MKQKQIRIARIVSLKLDEVSEDEIIKKIVDEFEVAEATVKRDLKEINETTVVDTEETEQPKAGSDSDEEKKVAYSVPKGEEGQFHVKLQRPGFDQKTGKRLHKPFIQKFAKREWKNFLLHKQGLEHEILHDPTK